MTFQDIINFLKKYDNGAGLLFWDSSIVKELKNFAEENKLHQDELNHEQMFALINIICKATADKSSHEFKLFQGLIDEIKNIGHLWGGNLWGDVIKLKEKG